MKGPINVKDIKIGKPDLGGISTEMWINALRDQVEALRKELDQAKKEIAAMRKTINSHGETIGNLSAGLTARIAALESKAATHVHRYAFPDVQVFQTTVVDGTGKPLPVVQVTANTTFQETLQPK